MPSLYVTAEAEETVVGWISLMGKSPVAEDNDSIIVYTPLRGGDSPPQTCLRMAAQQILGPQGVPP